MSESKKTSKKIFVVLDENRNLKFQPKKNKLKHNKKKQKEKLKEEIKRE